MDNSSSDRKPHILRFLSRMSVGGVQTGIIESTRHADRETFDFSVLCYKKRGKLADELEALNVPVYAQKALPVYDPYQIWRLSRVMRRLKPDLVHIFMAPSAIVGASAAMLAGVKHVVIQHVSLYEDRHWSEQSKFLNAWEGAVTRRADAVIAVTQAVADCSQRCQKLDPSRLHVVLNGISLDKFESQSITPLREELGVAPDTPLVGIVSRYLDIKRIEDFIDAAGQVVRNKLYGDRPAPVFLIVGGGSDEYRQLYQQDIATISSEADIRLLGERNDIPGLLPNLDVGVIASEIEGFCLMLLEYMAAGVPVAATRIPAIRELCEHEAQALLSEPRDPKALAISIGRLLTDRQLSSRLSAAGKEHSKKFCWEKSERQYEAIYRKVLGLK